MNTLAEELGHLKTHVSYPASKAQVLEACAGMHDGRSPDEEWMKEALPERTYSTPSDVLAALLEKV